MDEIQELEAYKELLDSGQITEEEFSLLKQRLLGLETEEEKEAKREAARAQALEDLKAMRAEEARMQEDARREAEEELDREEAEQREQERREAEKQAKQLFDEEKVKEKARLRAQQELEEEQKASQTQTAQNTVKRTSSIAATVLLWVVTVLLLLWGIELFGDPDFADHRNAFMIISGILSFLLALMACPLITSITWNHPRFKSYHFYRRSIVTVCVVLCIVTYFAAYLIS